MSESKKNHPTDEQLNSLLRDVAVPDDLKSQLARIPQQPPPALVSKAPGTTGRQRPWFAIVMAASLLGIGLFAAARYWPTEPGGFQAKQPSDPTNQPIDQAALEAELVGFLEGQAQLDAAIQAVELAHLKTQLAELEQAAANRLEQREVESLIAAMSQQYAVPAGASRQKIQTEMNLVIERYPGTQGAQIAHRFLAQEAQ